ncbi:MAG: DUF401 family protein [Planctomycetes bacterium]|nr:DUF401 family protein [Planctomycetota bacterium]
MEQFFPQLFGATTLLVTLGSFLLILVLARLKVPLAAAMAAGAVAIGLLLASSPADILRAAKATLKDPTTIGLLVITFIQLSLSETLTAAGKLGEMVESVRVVLRRPAITMAAMPAIIGLLPMPGGAIFSAPMVQTAAGGRLENPGTMSAINYWFRHIWEHWWPMYPGVILAMTLTGSDFATFATFQSPMGLMMVVSGLVIFIGTHGDLHRGGPRPPPGAWLRMLKATAPIWLILIVWIPLALFIEYVLVRRLNVSLDKTFAKFAPLSLGLLASLFWSVRTGGLGWRGLGKTLTRTSIYKMVLLVLCVMFFQQMIKATQAAPKIGQELAAMNCPVIAVVAILPFIAGLVMGLAVGFVGASFPIILPLSAGLAGGHSLIPYVALAYAFGHLGQMMSPVHVCHVVSNQFFKTSYGPVYRKILPPALLTAAMTTGYFLLLRYCLH